MWYKNIKISANKELQDLVNRYKEMYPGLDLAVWETSNETIEIAHIELPQELRNQGIGSKIVRDIQQYAKSVEKPVVLSPEADRGKKQALERFYKRLGFVHNKGRNKDYRLSRPFSATMYWKP